MSIGQKPAVIVLYNYTPLQHLSSEPVMMMLEGIVVSGRGATFSGDGEDMSPPHSEIAFLSPPVLSLECDTKQGNSVL